MNAMDIDRGNYMLCLMVAFIALIEGNVAIAVCMLLLASINERSLS